MTRQHIPAQFLSNQSDTSSPITIDPTITFECQESTFSSNAYLKGNMKRSFDLVIGIGLIIALAPLMLNIVLLVKLSSKGPVLFRQNRNGQQKQQFKLYKFRTMHVNSDENKQVQDGDPRITYVGRFLRRLSLDEIPQLINVVKGEMSLIGPRPHPVALDEKYEAQISIYGQRFVARPGITGLAQVNGARGETPTVEHMLRRVRLDLVYNTSANLRLDINILLRSALEILYASGR